MKTLVQVAVMAALVFLVSNAGYAVSQTSAAVPVYKSPTMVLAEAAPAVDASISPGAGPETSAEPVSRASHADRNKGMAKTPTAVTSPAAPAARTEETTLNPGISGWAASQGMPSGQSMNAALAASTESNSESAAPTYDELNKRIESLSKEISALRKDLDRLKTQGTAAR